MTTAIKRKSQTVFLTVLVKLSAYLILGAMPMSAVEAADYFVSPTGSDSHPGTVGEPFATIQEGMDQLQAGDTLHLREGSYHEQVRIVSLHGRKDKPITVKAYEGEQVTLDGSVPIRSTWAPHRGRIFKTKLAQPVWQLFVEKKSMSSARWPNGNWIDGSLWDTARSMAWPEEDRSSFGHHYNAGLKQFDFSLEGAIIVVASGSFRTYQSLVTDHDAGSDNFKYLLDGVRQHTMGFTVDRHRYFLEGKLGLLDVEGEWFYDPSDSMLYLWAPGGADPESLDVRGKTLSYALDVADSSFLSIQGLNLFGTTFQFADCHHVAIEDCRLLYPSYSKRMLRDLGSMDVTKMLVEGEFSPAYNTVRNCTIEYADGPALEMNGLGNVIENCYMHDIDYSCTYKGGYTLNMIDAAELTFRRNTIHTTGPSELFKAGVRNLIELNDLSRSGYCQNDGAMIQVSVKQQDGNVTRYNWVHDSVKQGFRFDNSNKPNSPWGENGRAHHNVAWNVARQFIKGDKHFVHNNLCFDCTMNDLSVSSNIAIQGRNFSTITRNNIAGMLSGDIRRPASQFPLPGMASHNWSGVDAKRDVRTQLRDPDHLDFRPRVSSQLIDAGSKEVGVKLAYLGKAPDIGPYEYGDKNYWIPGRQLDKASRPIPPRGATGIKLDADLMWLPGREVRENRVFTGTDPNALELRSVQDNNIFVMRAPPNAGATLYWRVDTVIAGGQVLPGDIWHFTTDNKTSKR